MPHVYAAVIYVHCVCHIILRIGGDCSNWTKSKHLHRLSTILTEFKRGHAELLLIQELIELIPRARAHFSWTRSVQRL